MASSPFEVEDQTDEDFFDKLVNDDDDEFYPSGSMTTCDEAAEASDVAKTLSNLSVSKVGPTGVYNSGGDTDLGIVEAKKDGKDVVLPTLNDHMGTVFAKESETLVDSNVKETVNESSGAGVGEEAGLDGVMDNSSVGSGKGVKVVQWSSFYSDSHTHSGSGFRSGVHLDFLNELKDNSEDPFANVGNTENLGSDLGSMGSVSGNAVADLGASGCGQNLDGQHFDSGSVQNAVGQDLSSSQHWDNMYPGWRYDLNTGQWRQVDGYDANATANVNVLDSFDVNAQPVSELAVSNERSDTFHLQQTAQSLVGNVAEGYITDSFSNWNQSSQGTVEYPAHMVFDPQYPGWYYDTIAQEWKLLESYNPAANQSVSVDYKVQYQNNNIENYGSQGVGGQDYVTNWGKSLSNYSQQNTNVWQTQPAVMSEATVFAGSQQSESQYGLTSHVNNSPDQPTGFKPSESIASFDMASQGFGGNNEVHRIQSFNPAEQFFQYRNQTIVEPSQQLNFLPAHFASQKSISFGQQPFDSGTHFSSATSEGRSSVGRPPHALVTFGFGGKLIVMKNESYFQTNLAYGSKELMGGVINVLNLMDVVMDKTDGSSFGSGAHEYFHILCQQSFPGPLVGGNVGTKELNKWIDDRIANSESSFMNYRSGDVVRLLFSLLKIACQYYGKLRSPFGADPGLMESDCPESAVANLFATAKINSAQPSAYGAVTRCLQNFPSEAQIQATALEVQKLLISGRKKEALECAQDGQLWGPALVLASQLGNQLYGDTVKQMALKQLAAGSPLRTLCLLFAGNPADVFSNVTATSNLPGSINTYQQLAQVGANGMLDKWEENLAIVTANRTNGDELVIIHLGDCLWKERGEVTAAHLCYLVADANFEPYSESARLCLIGADHWKFPRTYASPEAIQRTEVYEYSKVLGNSQFLLLPFQPYKLIYAHMLAEVGKISDSLKYCQAILKSLKTGRVPEVDTWRQLVLSLEERLRTHQQGGYGNNLAPTKLVGKLLNFFDNTAHRVVGGLPPPIPSTSHSSIQHNEYANQAGGPKVSSSQSTMAMPSLVPSASMEPISEWAGETNRQTVPNRSISEPDFGRSPAKVNSPKKASPSHSQEKATVSVGSSRFGRFGSQIFQRTVGLVLRSRPDRQAKLGERNKFYYDEKLKRWVEEGAEPPAEEAALPPPPTTTAFQNGIPDHNANSAPESDSSRSKSGPEYMSLISSERSVGTPPMLPSSNQFSAHGRMGVRARYVDTFNKGSGTPASFFQSPSVPTAKPGGGGNPKFFIPTPVVSVDETVQKTGESMEEPVVTNENPTTSLRKNLMSSPSTTTPTPTSTSTSTSTLTPPSPSTTMPRFPSMDNIIQKSRADVNSSVSSHSRRVASWSGSLSDSFNPSTMNKIKPPGEAIGMTVSSYTPSEPQSKQYTTNGNNFGDELHEVQL